MVDFYYDFFKDGETPENKGELKRLYSELSSLKSKNLKKKQEKFAFYRIFDAHFKRVLKKHIAKKETAVIKDS